jgi:hypothetical protein
MAVVDRLTHCPRGKRRVQAWHRMPLRQAHCQHPLVLAWGGRDWLEAIHEVADTTSRRGDPRWLASIGQLHCSNHQYGQPTDEQANTFTCWFSCSSGILLFRSQVTLRIGVSEFAPP